MLDLISGQTLIFEMLTGLACASIYTEIVPEPLQLKVSIARIPLRYLTLILRSFVKYILYKIAAITLIQGVGLLAVGAVSKL